MRILQQKDAFVVFDLSNIVARAQAIGKENWLKLYTRMLIKQRKQYNNHDFVFAVEGAGTLARQKILPCYKAGRVPTPEFQTARKIAVELARHTHCLVIRAPDGEADDAIATFVTKKQDADIVIISNDRDLWQLISPSVKVRSQIAGSTATVDKFACVRHLGVLPEAIPMLKALCGDSSDEIPRSVSRINQDKLKRLAQLTAGMEEQLCQVARESDFLTDNEKKKIQDAFPTVKKHLKVVQVKRQLKLSVRKCAGDQTKLKEFLEAYQSDVFSDTEISKLAGE